MSQAHPLPWRAKSDPCGRVWIEDAAGQHFAHLSQGGTKREVRALLATAKVMAASREMLTTLRSVMDSNSVLPAEVEDRVAALIAKVEGEDG